VGYGVEAFEIEDAYVVDLAVDEASPLEAAQHPDRGLDRGASRLRELAARDMGLAVGGAAQQGLGEARIGRLVGEGARRVCAPRSRRATMFKSSRASWGSLRRRPTSATRGSRQTALSTVVSAVAG
jgi:hypothetical protein